MKDMVCCTRPSGKLFLKTVWKKGRHFHVIIVRLLDELFTSIIGQIKSNHFVIPLLPEPVKRQVKTSCPLRKKPFRVILSSLLLSMKHTVRFWHNRWHSSIYAHLFRSPRCCSDCRSLFSYLNHDPRRCQQVHMGQKLVWANCLLRATSA